MGKIYTQLLAAAAICSTALAASAQGPVDMTSKIRENTFYAGWYGNTPGWNSNDLLAEYYDLNQIEAYQILGNMPAGIYTLECNAFERPTQRLNEPKPDWQINTFIYIKPGTSFSRKNNVDQYTDAALDVYTYGVPVKFLYSEDEYSFDPYTFPNNMTQSKEAFEKGQYLNTATCTLEEDGPLRFGITIPTQWGRFWICFDNFKLYYQENEGSEKVDYTSYIADADFSTDPTHNAWTEYPAVSYEDFIKSRAFEWYRKTINTSQTITGLEAGRYKVTCQAFKRDYPEVTMFANDVEAPIADFWSADVEGLNSKQNLTAAGELFGLGHYINNVIVELNAGDDLTIGLKKEGTANTDWVAAHGFGLYYLPALAVPAHNLDVKNGKFEHDFLSEGSIDLVFSLIDGESIYYKWNDGEYTIASDGNIEISGAGEISYYVTNADDQISPVETITFINKSTVDGPINMSYRIKNQEYIKWEGNPQASYVADNFYEKFNWGVDNVWQKLYNMPAGIYTVKCQAFYRNGDNLTAYKDNTEFAYLYINGEQTPFNSLYSETAYTASLNEEGTGFTQYNYPDNVAQAMSAFDQDLYWVSATVTIAEGEEITIGHQRYNDNDHGGWRAGNWHCSTGFHLYYQTDADAPMQDITDKLSNPDFKKRDGKWFNKNEWDGNSDLGIERAYNAKEKYQGDYTFTQTIAGLPAGRYRVQLQGFMSGNQTPWDDIDPDTEEITATHDPACYLIANNEKQALMPFDGYTDNVDGLTALQSAGRSFDDDMYNDNRVFVEIEEGEDIVLGLTKQISRSRDWVAFRDFSLYYLPAIEAPAHNLDIIDGAYEHDFDEDGDKTVTFSHPSADVNIYYMWEPAAADAQLMSVKEGYAEVPADGLTITTPGTLSFYAENSEGQQSPVQTVSVRAKDTSTGSINLIADDQNAPVEYYNLQGMRINTPAVGSIVIEKRGNTVKKIVIR